jgi:hypothetical protein
MRQISLALRTRNVERRRRHSQPPDWNEKKLLATGHSLNALAPKFVVGALAPKLVIVCSRRSA